MNKVNSTLNFFYRTTIHWGWGGMGGQNVGLRGHGDLPQGHHSALYQSRCLKIQKIGAFERFGQNVAKKRSWKWQRWSQIARNYALVWAFFVILSFKFLIIWYMKFSLTLVKLHFWKVNEEIHKKSVIDINIFMTI